MEEKIINKSRFSKKQKLICICAVLFSIALFAYWAFHAQANSAQIKVDELSERAKEFIEEEKKKSGSSWKSSDLENSEAGRASTQPKTFTTECMTIEFPVVSRNEHTSQEGEMCKIELRMDSPPARVVITVKPFSGSLRDESGVNLRKKFPDEYKERIVNFPQWSEAFRYDQKDGTVLFLKNDEVLTIVGITEMLQPERLSDALVNQIVQGIILE